MDGLKEATHRIFILHQTLIVPTQRDQEQNTRDILETVDPFSSLALLTADVDHEHVVIAQREDRLRDANCPRAGVDDILFIRNVRRVE